MLQRSAHVCNNIRTLLARVKAARKLKSTHSLCETIANVDLGRRVNSTHELWRSLALRMIPVVNIYQPWELRSVPVPAGWRLDRINTDDAGWIARRGIYASAAPMRGTFAAVIPGLPQIVTGGDKSVGEGRIWNYAVVA